MGCLHVESFFLFYLWFDLVIIPLLIMRQMILPMRSGKLTGYAQILTIGTLHYLIETHIGMPKVISEYHYLVSKSKPIANSLFPNHSSRVA